MSRWLQRLKPFATTATALGVVTALGGVAGVLASRTLGPYERGLLATAVVWASVLGFLVSVGVPQAATHFVAREPHRRAIFASAGLVLGCVAGLVLAIGGAVGATIVVSGGASFPMAIVFAAALPTVIGTVAIGIVLGTEAFWTWSVLRAVHPLIYLGGIVLIASTGGRTAVAVATVLAVAALAQAALGLAILRRRRLLARPTRKAMQAIISYGWRNIVAGAGWLVSYRLDQLVLSVAASASSLGVYAVASSFGEVIVPMGTAAGSVMLARVSAQGIGEVRRTLPLAIVVCVGVAGSLALFAFLLAPDLLRMLFGAKFSHAVSSLRILMPGAVALAVSTVLADTLRGLRRPLVPAYAELAGALTTGVLLVLLIPRLGIEGAAIASTVSYITVTVCLAVSLRVQMRKSAAESRTNDLAETLSATEIAEL